MRIEARRRHAGSRNKKDVVDFLRCDLDARQQLANGFFTELQRVRDIKFVLLLERMVAFKPFRRHAEIAPVNFRIRKNRQKPIHIFKRAGKQTAHDIGGRALLDHVLRNHRLDSNNLGMSKSVI